MKHAVRSYFGTSSEDPDAWLAHYGRVARTNGWWTDVALLWNVGVAFEGAAEVWYGSVEAWSLQQGRTWDEFRQAFLRRFKPSHFSELLENSLRTTRQEGDEDIATYAGRFVSLHSRLPVGGPSLDALRYCWIRGLARDDWRDRLMMEVPMTFEEALERSLRLEGAVAIMNATARLDPSTPTLETFRTSTASVSEGTRRPLGDAANVQELATALAHVLTTSAQDRRPPIRGEADGPRGSGRAMYGEPPRDDIRAHDYERGFRRPRGTIVCYVCNERGHIAQHCPRRTDGGAPVRLTEVEREAQVMPVHKKKRARGKNLSDPGDQGKVRRRVKGQKRHINMVQQPGCQEYSIVHDLANTKAGISVAQLLNISPALRKELKSGLALQPSRPVPLDQAVRDACGEPVREARSDVELPDDGPSHEAHSNVAQAGVREVGIPKRGRRVDQSLRVDGELAVQSLSNIIIDGGLL